MEITSNRTSRPAFVLVHGAWHGAWCFERLVPLLSALGHAAVARDLPAHGLNASFPAAYNLRPLNHAAFATEPSASAATTLDDYANSIIATIDQVRALGHDKVVLVGHSMGGVAITAAAQKAPGKIHRLVYLTAFMPKSGVPAVSYIQAPENAGELVGPQLMSDPAVTGALRMDHRSQDAAYGDRTRQAFGGDMSQAAWEGVANLLTPDVPVAPFATPIELTADAWGALDRHYMRCTQDMAIRPPLQQRFIEEADESFPNRKTVVHSLETSHSPFLSAPRQLAELLAKIAA